MCLKGKVLSNLALHCDLTGQLLALIHIGTTTVTRKPMLPVFLNPLCIKISVVLSILHAAGRGGKTSTQQTSQQIIEEVFEVYLDPWGCNAFGFVRKGAMCMCIFSAMQSLFIKCLCKPPKLMSSFVGTICKCQVWRDIAKTAAESRSMQF